MLYFVTKGFLLVVSLRHLTHSCATCKCNVPYHSTMGRQQQVNLCYRLLVYVAIRVRFSFGRKTVLCPLSPVIRKPISSQVSIC
uniref:SJCHGC09778 protein n=1 Tax=Schistosoma japonicum TaxID=6182 RepID=Q5BQX0_SCHJA|nr:SJCHGC09778 protein [Schistosoma japonicum]